MDMLSFATLASSSLELQIRCSPYVGDRSNPLFSSRAFAWRKCESKTVGVSRRDSNLGGLIQIPSGNGFSRNIYGFSLLTPGSLASRRLRGFRVCAVTFPALAMDVEAVKDVLVCLFTIGGALSSLKVFDELAKRDVFDKILSRKLVHITIGLIFMLFWPLFSDAPTSRYLAALAPAGNAVRMLALGLGFWEDRALVKAVTREGNKKELLKGPLYYAIAISAVTILFWRTSPISAVAIANLCAGDGVADIVGRRFGFVKLPYNKNKSYAGSIAMFIFSSLVSIIYLWFFSSFGFYIVTNSLINQVILVSLLTALVESLSVSTSLDDNFTVPFTAVIAGMLMLN
ncbi:hypothetical protein O6H91_18G002600 [Diphasiastrum complanatum]|uniref:Uncharacterized protein n=1 Tax=Diphasiastrum complanatum TaxID=34168 RepID=A0ACC2AXH6_DIPCM|nr:hypothetical protein O6H91_18G002600 [Diphasiastrum complanatum]